ncbi:hotdog fold thioesterase [Sphingobacterium bambusae]|uniref:Hotdog fold thioesterase n=1 Tax=Sphingobacterium bambusae TaxID=662858 RepID=A0ABW6BDH9_9SPHI|nr:hotdog fold thioesterase [Sphingobacterium bambusae]WPL50783.1 hotdog fold thioesterase [Sphingobacterium bambusae]
MPNIWFKEHSLEEVNSIFQTFMTGYLDIKAIEIREDALVVSMPVTDKVRQPFGILHGGASVVLAESAGSVASNLVIDAEQYAGVGMEVNANHLKSVHGGTLIAICSPLHLGQKSHVWDIKISDESDRLICVSRLTVAIIEKK